MDEKDQEAQRASERAALRAECIAWAKAHPQALAEMREELRRMAEGAD